MTEEKFTQQLSEIHRIFETKQNYLHSLRDGINQPGDKQDILDAFLDALELEKNDETRYIAFTRLVKKHFEPLDMYLETLGKSREYRDTAFDTSYRETRKIYETLQQEILDEIEKQSLFTDFYRTILRGTHTLGKLYSDLFLAWNRKLIFGVNRDLEKRFGNDQEKIFTFLKENNLFDLGHDSKQATRSYSVLEKLGDNYVSKSYAEVFSDEINAITQAYNIFIQELEQLEDSVYFQHTQYINYYTAIQSALMEKDVDSLIKKWALVDIAWMDITSPLQPGHMLEYYEDKYRFAVSIESDIRIVDPSIPKSKACNNIKNMYEALYDEIGKYNFIESYNYSLHNIENVQLYIGSPVFMYGSFLCGSYSAQVVPNDDEVSKIYGKKIFSFPKSIYEFQKNAPKMKFHNECIDEDLIQKYDRVLEKGFSHYFEIYDIETIGHEYGHSLWLQAGSESCMNEKGYYKCIEEFKATAGALVAYFLSGGNEYLDEDMIVVHMMRIILLLRYRNVEAVLPYYCESLIHFHIFFTSGMAQYRNQKIHLNFNEKTFTQLKELYMSIYTQQIFTYLNMLEAGNFLFEFVKKEDGVYHPIHPRARSFIDYYFEAYKQKGNEIV